MKLKYLGYREKKVETRELTIAELKLSIIEAYVNKGVKEVQIIDITSGDTTTFNSIEDVVRNEWSGSYKIELINLPHAYGTKEETKAIIIFQEAEEESDKVIA
jgi:hypothetical protein